MPEVYRADQEGQAEKQKDHLSQTHLTADLEQDSKKAVMTKVNLLKTQKGVPPEVVTQVRSEADRKKKSQKKVSRKKMPRFGKKSKRVLSELNEDLQELLNEVIKYVDISLIEGKRSLDRQKELKKTGATKTLESKHLKGEAIDLAPYPIDWENRERFIYVAGIVKGIAFNLGIPIVWGGDWNNNFDLSDNNFDDLVHFELR